MKIGQTADHTGLSAKAIRYYESLGLVTGRRLSNGYRDYGPAEIRQLNLLAHARQVGFSLEECRYLLTLLADRERQSVDVKATVEEKIADLDQQMEKLQQMRQLLAALASRCAGNEDSHCAILQSLTEGETAMPFRLVDNH